MPDGFDPSLILGPAQAAGQNSFGNALLGAAQAGSALYNFQKQGAELAAGQDFQKAIGPDGQLSVPAYNKLLAGDPRAALAALDSSQAGQTNQATALSNQQAEIANTAARVGYIGNLFTGYTENAPTMKGFQSDIADGIRQGIIDPQTGAQILATSPDPSSPEFASFAKAEAQHMAAAAGQIARFLPQTQSVSGPGGTVITSDNPLAPGFAGPGTVVTPGVSPTTTTTDANGNPIYAPAAAPTVIAPGAPGPIGAAGALSAAAPGALGSGTMVNAMPAAGPPSSIPASGGGAANPLAGMPAGAQLGQAEAAQGSASAYNNFMSNVGDAPMRIFTLQKALGDLQGTNTGPGTAGRNEVISYANAALHALDPNAPGIDPKGVAAYDEANKYLTAYAQQQANSFGSGTDSALAAAFSSNPSTHISSLAAQDVVKTNIALERMGQVAAQVAQAQNVQPGQFLQWKAQFGTQVDPRAFAFPEMAPGARAALVKQLRQSPSQYQKFAQSLQLAVQYGAVDDPRQQQNAGQ